MSTSIDGADVTGQTSFVDANDNVTLDFSNGNTMLGLSGTMSYGTLDQEGGTFTGVDNPQMVNEAVTLNSDVAGTFTLFGGSLNILGGIAAGSTISAISMTTIVLQNPAQDLGEIVLETGASVDLKGMQGVTNVSILNGDWVDVMNGSQTMAQVQVMGAMTFGINQATGDFYIDNGTNFEQRHLGATQIVAQ